MKRLPITREIRDELDAINTAAWGHINGQKLTDKDISRIAHFTSELRRFDRFGREDDCPSALYHGPGHQSRCGCDRGPDHDGPHGGDMPGRGRAEWTELVAFTGYFDELPDVE